MKRFILAAALMAACIGADAKDYSVVSPSGKLALTLSVDQKTTYVVSLDGKALMDPARVAMTLSDGTVLGDNAKVKKTTKGSVTETVDAPFYRQSSFTASYNWLTIATKGGYSIELRAYDDGVAYRFVTNFKNDFVVMDETVEFNFAGKYSLLVPFVDMRKDKYESSFESQYTEQSVGDVNDRQFAFLPIYADAGPLGRILLMESDLEAYPGMYLNQTETGFKAEFPPRPSEIYYSNRGAFRPLKNCDHIAEVAGKRSFPWRIIAWGAEDKDLPVNNMVYALAAPSRVDDISWITPGQSTWDWWNGFRRYGVDFKAGINTETYKYDIDVAAKYGMKYIVVDEGWYSWNNPDIMAPIKEMDIPAIVNYGKEKGVKVVLWTTGGLLDRKLEEACKHYSEIGVAGFKVDFFDSQDQMIVEQIYRIAETCAKYRLALDLHGMYKPTGLSRTYPNVLNYEGVFGLEQLKWTDRDAADMPRNDAIIPYIRMASGPLDYTQGALRNAQKGDFRAINLRPMSQGTRAHQVALYVVFDSPFAMLCDSPSDYLAEDATTRFITSIPAVFDHTAVLSGKVGESIVTAREKDGKWYVGGITDWNARTLEVDFSFLPEGEWNVTLFEDGVNSADLGTDYKIESFKACNKCSRSVQLAPGGGFAMIIGK